MRLTRFGMPWQGLHMQFPARLLMTFAWLSAGGATFALGQNLQPPATLQMPVRPQRDQPVKPPAAAPREPVHQVESAVQRKTPVVPPHGQLHPHKLIVGPAAPSGTATAAQPSAASVVPATPTTGPQPRPEKSPDVERSEGETAKLPRFASLRSDDVNMRAGPGTRYRIDWVYKRRDLPVEIEREFDVWRWVRDADGIQGWVHQATLMGRRSFVVQKTDATLRSEASDSASPVATLRIGVIGRIRSCEASSDWCNVQAGSYRGYLRREQFWGAFPGEAISP
jgi:SH3-like domain-containing protein